MLANWRHKRPLQPETVPAALPSWWASTSSRQAELMASSTLVWLLLFLPSKPNVGRKNQLVGRLRWKVLTQLYGWSQTDGQMSSRTGWRNTTAGEKAESLRNTGMTRSPQTDAERCPSHHIAENMDETRTVNLTGTEGIEVRLGVEIGGPLTPAPEAIEIGWATTLLPRESPAGAAVGTMVPNQPQQLLKFQILSQLTSWEGIVEPWRTSRSLRWSGLAKPIIYPPTNHSAVTACCLTKPNQSTAHSWFLFPILCLFKFWFCLCKFYWYINPHLTIFQK